MNRKDLYLMIISFLMIIVVSQTSYARGNMGSGQKMKNKPQWSPTSWQKKLPSIVINKDNHTRKYSFVKLIEADGYLCPGSARSYKTLLTALPLLFGEHMPDMEDITIHYTLSPCSEKVYKYFLGSSLCRSHLRNNENLEGRQHMIERNSTGKKILITYTIPDANGHTPESARAGDKVLKATDGDGMVVKIIYP